LATTYAQANGELDNGSGLITAVPATTGFAILYPPQNPANNNENGLQYAINKYKMVQDRLRTRVVIRIAGNFAFNLDYQFTTDQGTTWYQSGGTDQIASSTITVDGATAGYTQAAKWDDDWGFQGRIIAFNTTGSIAAYAYEWRLYYV